LKTRPFFWQILISLIGIGVFPTNLTADAISTFSASLTVNLTFPAPVLGVLGVSTTAAFLPPAVKMASGEAMATAANPTSMFANNVLTFTAGPVSGMAGPGRGEAQAVSFGTSETVVLTNKTAAALTKMLSGTYTYSLAAAAGAPSGVAGAAYSFQVDNTTDPTTLTLFGPQQNALAEASGSSSTATGTNRPIAAFAVTIPARSFIDITIDPFVSGEAFVAPEPSMLIPVFCAVGALFWIRKRARATNN
jgi:hypothetical protein